MKFEPPLTPDDDTARQWAREELEKSVYDNEPTLWDRFLSWLGDIFGQLGDWFTDLLGRVGVPTGSIDWVRTVIIVVVVLAVVGLAVWLVTRRIVQDAKQTRSYSVFEDDARTAAQIIAAARTASASGDHTTATVEAYRAIVRAAEEVNLIDDRPGVTADEASESIGVAFLTLAADVATSAGAFDAARYGDADSTPEQFLHADRTYEALLQALQPQGVA